MSRDRVTPALRQAVIDRDKCCVAFRIDPDHLCYDQWGEPHSPFATDYLSLEHVKTDLRMGVRAPSDLRHLVALCHSANVAVPSKAMRVAFREYLRVVNEGVA
jgi:hypothetical protein